MLALAATSGTPRPVALNGALGVTVTRSGFVGRVGLMEFGTPARLLVRRQRKEIAHAPAARPPAIGSWNASFHAYSTQESVDEPDG
jgi:hypothetical protein